MSKTNPLSGAATPGDTLSDKPEKNQKKLDKVHPVRVAQGDKQKIQGVVSIRSGDSFKVRDPWRRRDFGALDGNHKGQLAPQGS